MTHMQFQFLIYNRDFTGLKSRPNGFQWMLNYFMKQTGLNDTVTFINHSS